MKVNMELEQFVKLINLAESLISRDYEDDDVVHDMINVLHVVIAKEKLLGGVVEQGKEPCIVYTGENGWLTTDQHYEMEVEGGKERDNSVRAD